MCYVIRLREIDFHPFEWPVLTDVKPIVRTLRAFVPSKHRGDCICPLCVDYATQTRRKTD